MIRRSGLAALGAAALSTALAACSPDEAGAQASPAAAPNASEAPAAPAALPDIDAEAQRAADAIDESNADEELERLKSELESE